MGVKIKAILFDLDGTLVDAKDWHFRAFNQALEKYGVSITYSQHLAKYDGISTKKKLNMLSDVIDLSREHHEDIYRKKQELTFKYIENHCCYDADKVNLMVDLKRKGYTLVCCSNAISKSVNMMLQKLGILQYFDYVLSNEDVKNPKPDPAIYNLAVKKSGYKKEECLAIEDNERGIKSAIQSGVNILRVYKTSECNKENILKRIDELDTNDTSSINIVIPMAGDGRRFRIAGYKKPKPFIDVNGKPMICRVLDNLNIKNARFVLLARKEHMLDETDTVADIINNYNAVFVPVDKKTEGSACTVLLARKYINNNTPLVLANSDQLIDIDFKDFIHEAMSKNVDGSIITFYDDGSNPKWSYVEVDKDGIAKRVEEKVAISDEATIGVYYFANGSEYVNGAIDMIANNDRVKGEFYNCPIYNYLIKEKLRINTYKIDKDKCHGLGTPEDLQIYLSRK